MSTDLHEMLSIIDSSVNTSHLAMKFMYDLAMEGKVPTKRDLTAIAFLIQGLDRLSGEADFKAASKMLDSVHKHRKLDH